MPIVIPMVISQIFDTMMTFVDRLFLSYVSPLAMAAAMSGGLTAFLCGYIAFGLISYCSTLVAHRYGAGRQSECPRVVAQGVWIALAAYPLVLLVGGMVGHSFALIGHTPDQIALESTYFRIMIAASIIGLLRAAFIGFFAGIGQTRIIMVGNAVALVVNVVANYALIFGKWGLPRLEVAGAALGTVLASGVMLLLMAAAFLLQAYQRPFRSRKMWRPDLAICRQLLRYGLPSSLDGFAGISGFAAVVMMLHAMGEEVAAAVTMFYNWELLSFFPLLGLQSGVATVVGQNMGARCLAGARQAVRAGLALMMLYTSLLALLFVFLPRTLLLPFAQSATPAIIELAVPMLQLAALYLIFDGASLVISGALRGAGDTLWTMVIGILFHLLLAGVCWFAIYICKAAPINVWKLICGTILLGAVAYGWRYRNGAWQQLNLEGSHA